MVNFYILDLCMVEVLTYVSRQAMDPKTRQYALDGTNTMLNTPPSANTTLTDVINIGYAAQPPIQIKDVMSTVKGPFCYIYD
jgi:tyrosinase